MPESIFDLLKRVRQHPDYVFGTIFVPNDFPDGRVPEDFPTEHANDALAEAGNLFIEQVVGER